MKMFETSEWGLLHLYSFDHITFEPGVTVLLGCNGAGKTTLQNEVKAELHESGIPYFDYSSLRSQDKMDYLMYFGGMDVGDYARSVIGSEGENMKSQFNYFMRDLGEFVSGFKSKSQSDDLYVFIDSMDSGWSIDNIDELCNFLGDMLVPDVESLGLVPHVIIAANAYEFARCFPDCCVDAMSGERVGFESYEGYRDYILETRERKDSRTDASEKLSEKGRRTAPDGFPGINDLSFSR